ncbi:MULTISPECIES: Lar family restriction alleviation protein [unclassified Pseudomonas]|uniref:Lar family restriction alleviation protein n=1 Tax=unclassified Pseudomonas TaxID=196821 RepID=UPI00224B37C2|nr:MULTISPECIES: Lar family restriction alleviation protein [unclassified Pseudomonas]MCX2814953.1 Lar family restriction alleviation protein [Pseudomonas sp. DCB_E]MCX9144165.1 Lar family restriction alleviation protein [Pseudomonas sp. DCB_Q]
MPTENRSSNTEMAAKLNPCPFCGQQDAFVEQLDSDASVVICQGRIDEYSACLARGPVGVQQHECEDQPGRDQAVKEWNKRAAAQNHPEPLAWMVGTAIWWTKEEAERDAAEVGLPMVGLGPMKEPSVPAVSIPDGYCLMPRRLTAENGAKALLLGEFKLEVTRECPECLELDEPVEGCEVCDGEGEYAQHHTIPWDKIKFIYSEAVKGLALQPNAAQ